MKTGMLWFDDDPKHTLAEKLGRASTRFKQKYGLWPNLVYYNPRTDPYTGDIALGEQRMTLKHARSILPNHFWLGLSSG